MKELRGLLFGQCGNLYLDKALGSFRAEGSIILFFKVNKYTVLNGDIYVFY